MSTLEIAAEELRVGRQRPSEIQHLLEEQEACTVYAQIIHFVNLISNYRISVELGATAARYYCTLLQDTETTHSLGSRGTTTVAMSGNVSAGSHLANGFTPLSANRAGGAGSSGVNRRHNKMVLSGGMDSSRKGLQFGGTLVPASRHYLDDYSRDLNRSVQILPIYSFNIIVSYIFRNASHKLLF
ncbi:unnamed protein product [Protopolystoma xenopodis]|uniref:Uncharacterized protein n=1 Tax=Protopolystoma xenopodis TaxID=117903 RepID=A0A3S4ZZ56_9PLAT|nr:unnamed protein product [Protopolystoma xenopodis]